MSDNAGASAAWRGRGGARGRGRGFWRPGGSTPSHLQMPGSSNTSNSSMNPSSSTSSSYSNNGSFRGNFRGRWMRGKGFGGSSNGRSTRDNNEGDNAESEDPCPRGIEEELWGMLSYETKMEIYKHLDLSSASQGVVITDETKTANGEGVGGSQTCYKCGKSDPTTGTACNYSSCDRFVCGGCAQALPLKQKGGKRIKTDKESDEVSLPEDSGDMMLCSRCKPQVAYCRRCLGLKEVRDLVHCFFCKRKICKACENVVLGKKGSKKHFHQCRSCANHQPESYMAWKSGHMEAFQPCKSRFCSDGDVFEVLTDEEAKVVAVAIESSQRHA